MTPEETLNQQIWAVLQDIKEDYQINTRKEGDVKCILPDFKRAKNICSPDRIRNILRFLEKEGAFKIRGFTNERRNAKYLIINPTRFEEIYKEYEQKNNSEEDEYDEDDIFNHDGSLSSGYENTDLELFILKKILLEHKRRDDSGFFAKELSFNNNSLEKICTVINRLMEDKILYLSANTSPERTKDDEGIEDVSGFINWKMVKRLEKHPQVMNKENGCVIFDTYMLDEVKLKGRIDIAIEEFMNDKIYSTFGYLIDKSETKEIIYPYNKQRKIIISEITKDNRGELLIPLNDFRDKKVDVLKTLLALEKENLLRITGLQGNPMYDQKGFIGKWTEKDNPIAQIYMLKTQANKQEPMLVKLVAGSEVKINEFEENGIKSKRKNRVSIPVKDARLSEQNHMLEINNGEKIISFKSKKKEKDLEKETKQYKVLYHLWDFRWEFKNSKVLKKGSFASLDNLAKGSGCESTGAAYKHVQRLNKKFASEGVAIKIEGENEKYRLVIEKA